MYVFSQNYHREKIQHHVSRCEKFTYMRLMYKTIYIEVWKLFHRCRYEIIWYLRKPCRRVRRFLGFSSIYQSISADIFHYSIVIDSPQLFYYLQSSTHSHFFSYHWNFMYDCSIYLSWTLGHSSQRPRKSKGDEIFTPTFS